MESDNMPALLPCPFCGSPAKLEREWRAIPADPHAGFMSAGGVIDDMARCTNPRCGAKHHAPHNYGGVHWNTREEKPDDK